MENSRIKVWLTPMKGGSYTRIRLLGTLPTALPVWELRHLMERIRFFSGSPLECVLSADLEEVSWSEWWNDLLAAIPVRLLEIGPSKRTRFNK